MMIQGSSIAKTAALTLLLSASVLAGCIGTVDESIKQSCGGEPTAAEAPAPPPVAAPAWGHLEIQPALGEPLKLGTMLPITGSLSAFGGDMEKAARLAVQQINEAGGINGQPVTLERGDTKTDAAQAATAFTSLVDKGVAGVAGAASSGVTGGILDLAIDNEVFVFSPASTSPALTLERNNRGWFARVPPSDALQGKVLADLVYEDGCRSVAIMGVKNAYGQGLGEVFQESFRAHGGRVLGFIQFEEGGTSYASQVEQVGQGDPDAIVFIGYPTEGGQIVKEAFQKGLMSDAVFFFSEGVKDEEFIDLVGKDSNGDYVLAGLRGTAPDAAQTTATDLFRSAFRKEFGSEPKLFAAESYDAIMAMALTAAYAGNHTGEAIKDNLRTVYNAPGTRVSVADLPGALLAAHTKQDLDYVGVSNDFDLDVNGDPSTGVYSYWSVTDDGKVEAMRGGITP